MRAGARRWRGHPRRGRGVSRQASVPVERAGRTPAVESGGRDTGARQRAAPPCFAAACGPRRTAVFARARGSAAGGLPQRRTRFRGTTGRAAADAGGGRAGRAGSHPGPDPGRDAPLGAAGGRGEAGRPVPLRPRLGLGHGPGARPGARRVSLPLARRGAGGERRPSRRAAVFRARRARGRLRVADAGRRAAPVAGARAAELPAAAFRHRPAPAGRRRGVRARPAGPPGSARSAPLARGPHSPDRSRAPRRSLVPRQRASRPRAAAPRPPARGAGPARRRGAVVDTLEPGGEPDTRAVRRCRRLVRRAAQPGRAPRGAGATQHSHRPRRALFLRRNVPAARGARLAAGPGGGRAPGEPGSRQGAA